MSDLQMNAALLPYSASPAERRFETQAAVARGSVNSLRRPKPVAKIQVDVAAEPPADKLKRLLERDHEAARAWERTDSFAARKPAPLQDAALAACAGRAGWSDQELADLIIAARRKHGESVEPAALEDSLPGFLGAVRTQLAEESALREVSREFAGVFMGQFLRAMRATVHTSEFGSGGSEEQTFQALLDDELANEAARSESYGLSDLIYQGLLRKASLRWQPESGQSAAAVPASREFGPVAPGSSLEAVA